MNTSDTSDTTETRATRRPEYALWKALTRKLTNPTAPGYARLGGRGVVLDPRWRGAGGFAHFLADVGPRPFPKAGLERIDPAGPFGPGNVRWADTRPCRLLTHAGRTLSITRWARELNIRPATLRARLHDRLPEKQVFARCLRNGMYMQPFEPETRAATGGGEFDPTQATADALRFAELVARAVEVARS